MVAPTPSDASLRLSQVRRPPPKGRVPPKPTNADSTPPIPPRASVSPHTALDRCFLCFRRCQITCMIKVRTCFSVRVTHLNIFRFSFAFHSVLSPIFIPPVQTDFVFFTKLAYTKICVSTSGPFPPSLYQNYHQYLDNYFFKKACAPK